MKEYLWQPYGQGSYLLDKMPHGDGGEIRRYVEYPLKDDDVWRFNEVIKEKDRYEDADKVLHWILSETEENEIKSYIRDVLRPSNLYEESEEKEMREMTVLSFSVPSELANEVSSIVSRFEGVPVDTNFKGDQNPLDVAEIERLTKENGDLKNELNKGHETVNSLSDKYNDAKIIIQTILREINDIDRFQAIFEDSFPTEQKAKEFEVEEYIQKKYKVTKVKAIKTIETEILVLQEEDNELYADRILDNAREEEVDGYFDEYSAEVSYEYEERNTIAEGLTKEQIQARYSQGEVFESDDCKDIWY